MNTDNIVKLPVKKTTQLFVNWLISSQPLQRSSKSMLVKHLFEDFRKPDPGEIIKQAKLDTPFIEVYLSEKMVQSRVVYISPVSVELWEEAVDDKIAEYAALFMYKQHLLGIPYTRALNSYKEKLQITESFLSYEALLQRVKRYKNDMERLMIL